MSRIYKTLGTVAPVPKGEYDASAYYEKLNIVTYQGYSYMAKQSAHGILPTNNNYWISLGGGVKLSDTILVFDNVAAMKASTLLGNGMVAQTSGYYSANDGGSAQYLIRTKTNEDTADDMFIIALADNTIVAELITDKELNIKQCGVIADGTTNDTTKMKAIITYAKANNLKIKANKNDVIVVNETLDISNLFVDFNFATIKTTSEINIFTYNTTIYYSTLQNVNIDCNGVATAGIHIENGRKVFIKDANIVNIKTYGIYYKAGYELVCDTINLQGTSTDNSTGIYITTGDAMFNNIILIDCKTGIHNIDGSNYFTNIHGWIWHKALIAGSIFFKFNAGKCFLTNCYSDTYQYSIYQYTQIPILEIVNFFNVYNTGIYDSTLATSYQPTFMYCETANGESLTRISNSTLHGYSNSINTKLTNLTSFNGDIVNSRVINFDYILPFNTVSTSNFSEGVTLNTSTLEKTNKCVYLNHIVNIANIADTKTFTIGKIPYYFRPNVEYIGMCSIGTGKYSMNNTAYIYIATNGDIQITVPSDVTGNIVAKLNITYITHKES